MSGLRRPRLIVNADDLGLSPAINRGIAELHAAGSVTSASLLMNLPATADALRRTRDSGLAIGVHLNVTVGPPLSGPGDGLTRPDGWMGPVGRVLGRLASGQLRLATVEREWAAQIEAFLATGRQPSHLDSHLHLHALPGLTGLTVRLARRYGIGAVRLPAHGLVLRQAVPLVPQWLVKGWRLSPRPGHPVAGVVMSEALVVLTAMGQRGTAAGLSRLLTELPAGVTELVTHPGYIDDELRRLDPLVIAREHERRVLADHAWPARLADLGIELISFRELVAGPIVSRSDA